MKLAYWGAMAVAVVVGSSPDAAHAQVDARAEARQHFDRGLALAEGYAYAEAVMEFNRAYTLSPHYAVLFNLSQAYIALGQSVYAVDTLRRYLSEGGSDVPASRRKQIESDIAQQEQRIAYITVRSAVAGASVRLDGVEVGRTPLAAALRADAGAHVLTAELAGYKTWETRVEVAGKDQHSLYAVLEPLPAPPTGPVPALVVAAPSPVAAGMPPTSPAPVGPSAPAAGATSTSTPMPVAAAPHRLPAYIVGGLGVGALAVGAVFGLRAISKMDDSDKQCPQEHCTQQGVTLSNEAKTAALVSDITFGVGLVGVGVATYLLVRSPKAKPAPAMASRLRLAPAIAPGRAGVALDGSW